MAQTRNLRYGAAAASGGSVDVQPTKLTLENNLLVVRWSDGMVLEYDPVQLRQFCPCASCQSRPTGTAGLEVEPIAADPTVTIRELSPVGNYGYKIRFSDGHNTGIFRLQMLRRMGRSRGA